MGLDQPTTNEFQYSLKLMCRMPDWTVNMRSLANEITFSAVLAVHGPWTPVNWLCLKILAVPKVCSFQLVLGIFSVNFYAVYSLNLNTVNLNGLYTNIAVTCEKKCHFCYRGKLQSKESKHEVWCEIINIFRSYDYVDIVCQKLQLSVLVSSSFRKLNRRHFFETRCSYGQTRSSADADNALDANEAVPNKWRADGTHNTYQSY